LAVIRAAIVEDEAPARAWLRMLCAKHPSVRLVAECATAAEAAQKLRSTDIDLLLLDIRLGPINGFRVLDSVPRDKAPLVIVVTAYDQFAVQAFERNAVDYLLKPVREDRFRSAIDRAVRRLQLGSANDLRSELSAALEPLRESLRDAIANTSPNTLVAENDGVFRVIELPTIEYIASDRNYAVVHVSGEHESYRTRSTLQRLEGALDRQHFLRINRSYIVNFSQVARVDRVDGAWRFVMKGGATLLVGRSYREHVANVLRRGGMLLYENENAEFHST
jgi:two-component system, LytTR family, response regulator